MSELGDRLEGKAYSRIAAERVAFDQPLDPDSFVFVAPASG